MNLRKREEATQFSDDDVLAALHFITPTGEGLHLATLRGGAAHPLVSELLSSTEMIFEGGQFLRTESRDRVCSLAVNQAADVTELLPMPNDANKLSKRVRRWNRRFRGVGLEFALRIIGIGVDQAAQFYKIATQVDDDTVGALIKQWRAQQARRRGRKRERVQ